MLPVQAFLSFSRPCDVSRSLLTRVGTVLAEGVGVVGGMKNRGEGMNDDFGLASGLISCAYGGAREGLEPGNGGAEWAYGGESEEGGGFDAAAEEVEVEAS